MSPERWSRVKELVSECAELAVPARAGYLDRHCGADAELRIEVESLLRSYDEAGDALEEPALNSEPGVIGRRVGVYRIVEEIGEGGMSRVYRAVRVDDVFRKEVAIKLVKRGMDYEFILRRFRHERKIMAALEHPNIARLIDGGSTEDGVPYFIMEHISGRPIDKYCDERNLAVRERLELFRVVCAAVAFAHEHRIIHRDIKPGNILVTSEGVPKLLDFGIAKVIHPEADTQSIDPTATVLRLMTPEYASPEQIRGVPVTESTDVYSLGVLLYELLTGRRPHPLISRAPHEIARAICDTEPDRPASAVLRAAEIDRLASGTPVTITPDEIAGRRGTTAKRLSRVLSGDLDNIVLMALRKEPNRRYVSVFEFSEDIRHYLEGRPVIARKDTLAYRASKFLHRHRAGAIAAAAAVPLLALAAGGMWWRSRGFSGFMQSGAAPSVAPFTTLQNNETQPAFSPDGKSIAFVWNGEDGANSDIYIRRIDTGETRRITTDPAEDLSPVWEPGGNRIAFLRSKDNTTEVFVAPLPRGTHGMIAPVHPSRLQAVGRHLDWSPDGKYLAVADKDRPDDPFRIVLIRVVDGVKIPLTNPPAKSIGDMSPAFSPDGQWLSFLRAPSSGITDVWVTPLAGGPPRQVTSDNRVILSQAWASDSGSIVFSSNRTGGMYLWWIPLAGGTPRRIPGLGDGASEPSFSRDGRHLAYSQFFLDTNIWRLDRQRSAARKLVSSTQYDSSPAFSPDGKRIAFRSNRSGYHEIWTCEALACRSPAQLTHFAGPLTGTPRWSPDGRLIAFDTRPEGQADIYVIPSEGGVPRRITFETTEDVVPSWSRDGQWIYFASNRSGSMQIWKAPAAGGPKIQVTQNGGFNACESEDGKYLYYARSRSLPGIYRMPVEGGEETLVTDRLKPGYWGYWALSPDGIYLADTPTDGSRPGLYFFTFSTRTFREVLAVDKPFMIADSAFALSPDRRTILFTQVDQTGSDLMIADFGR